MANAWFVFVVRDRKQIFDVKKHPKGLTFFNCRWRNDKKAASRALQLYPKNNFFTEYDCYNLRNIPFKKNYVLQTTHFNLSTFELVQQFWQLH